MPGPVCPYCEARLPPEEVAAGWCETCGKKIPRFALSGSFGDPAGAAPPAAGPDEQGPSQGQTPATELPTPPALARALPDPVLDDRPARPPQGPAAGREAGEPAPGPHDESAPGLPRPLGDPLRGFRTFLGWALVLHIVFLACFALLGGLAGAAPLGTAWMQTLIALPFSAFVWRI